MATTAQNGIKLVAVMDGVTVGAYLQVCGKYPLYQTYDDAGVYRPNFEDGSVAASDKPVVALMLPDHATGELLTAQTVAWSYNGVELEFGGDGLSTNEGMEGLFEKTDSYQASYLGKTVAVPALKVLKNLVSLTNTDNDRISASGTVEVGGDQMEFREVSTEVVIQKRTDSTFFVSLNPETLVLDDTHPSGELEAVVMVGGNIASDLTGFTFEWYRQGADGDVKLSSATSRQTVTRDDVEGSATIKCVVKKDGAEKFTAFGFVDDQGDPLWVDITVAGIAGDRLRTGETATLGVSAYRRESGTAVTVAEASWRTRDNEGGDFTLSGKDGPTFGGLTVQVPYGEVKRAGYGLFVDVNVSADI